MFAPELDGVDRDQVRDWYNGYSWRGEEKVYNPFDILLLFDTREFAAHWFETGTPTFLVDTLFNRRVSSLALDGMVSNAELLSTFDVDDMPTEALLFQTGYLTIERPEPRGAEMFYRLGYPNREVRQSLNRSLLNRMTGDASRPVAHSARLYDLLLVNDFTGLAALVESFFASIPYEWYTNNDIASYEGFYASVFYSYGRIPDFPVTRSHPPASWPSAANSSICRTYRKTAGEESRRDLRVRVLRRFPLLVRRLLVLPRPVEPSQLRPRRRLHTRCFRQPTNESLVGFSRVPPLDAPHRRVRFQRRRIDADRLPRHQTRFSQPLQNPRENRLVRLHVDQPTRPRQRSSDPETARSHPSPGTTAGSENRPPATQSRAPTTGPRNSR